MNNYLKQIKTVLSHINDDLPIELDFIVIETHDQLDAWINEAKRLGVMS